MVVGFEEFQQKYEQTEVGRCLTYANYGVTPLSVITVSSSGPLYYRVFYYLS